MTSSIRSSVGIAATVVLVAGLATGLGGANAANAATTPTSAPTAAVPPASPTPSATVATTPIDPSLAQMNAAGNHTMGSTIPTDAGGAGSAATKAPKVQSRLVTPKAAVRPAGLPGMDVSAYQGDVDWASAYNNGARFAYVKATEGTGYVNARFAQQYNGSYARGMTRGAYHFAHPDSAAGAVAQAKYFVAHGGSWSADGRTLPPLLDIEYGQASQGGSCWGLSQGAMVTWIADFTKTVTNLTGAKPAIYTTSNWWKTCTGNSASFGAYPFFVAYYTKGSSAGTMPASWSDYTFWQHWDAGVFPGDQDVFNGSSADLQQIALGGRSITVKPVGGTVAGATMTANSSLVAGKSITSANRQYTLLMQTDGNLVLRGNGRAIWHTSTQGHPGARFVLQSDSNAVVYDAKNKPLWSSGTSKAGAAAKLVLGTNGDLVLSTVNGTMWRSGAKGSDSLKGNAVLTAGQYLHDASGSMQAVMQADGNFVVYVAGRAKWSTRTNGHPGAKIVLQKSGNVVLYLPTGRGNVWLWNSHTSKSGSGNALIMQSDGNLVLFNSTPHWIWQSHTHL